MRQALAGEHRGSHQCRAPAPLHQQTRGGATADIIGKMLAACASGSLLDVRDRALLALSFRCRELAALEVADLTEVDDWRLEVEPASQAHEILGAG
jgi:hypothetical protein